MGASVDRTHFFLLHAAGGNPILGAIDFSTPMITVEPPARSQLQTALLVGHILVTARLALPPRTVPIARILNTPPEMGLRYTASSGPAGGQQSNLASTLLGGLGHKEAFVFFLTWLWDTFLYPCVLFRGKNPNLLGI